MSKGTEYVPKPLNQMANAMEQAMMGKKAYFPGGNRAGRNTAIRMAAAKPAVPIYVDSPRFGIEKDAQAKRVVPRSRGAPSLRSGSLQEAFGCEGWSNRDVSERMAPEDKR